MHRARLMPESANSQKETVHLMPFFMGNTMGRIRTVKPELLTHEDLFMLEQDTGLPVRLAFVGLFTVCDREGRFKWQPNRIKLAVLPYDALDFSRVLDALATRGFIRMYSVNDEIFGLIPTWKKHQVINNRESGSEIPEPEESDYISMTSTREPRVSHATGTPLVHAHGEGKGREGKGIGKEGEGDYAEASPSSAPQKKEIVPAKPKEQPPTNNIWRAYSDAYENRYRAPPVRNAKVNGQLAQLIARLGAEEAPGVAAFYVGHNNRYYVNKMHSVDLLLSDCEKLRTEWATGNKVTAAAAIEADRLQDAGDMWSRLIDQHESQGE